MIEKKMTYLFYLYLSFLFSNYSIVEHKDLDLKILNQVFDENEKDATIKRGILMMQIPEIKFDFCSSNS